MTQPEVFRILHDERTYQDVKWGTEEHRNHTPGDYIVFMQSYLTDAIRRASTEAGWDGALEELRKVVALGVACFECNGVPERKVGR